MNKLEPKRLKEVGKQTISDFVRSESGSIGVKNAATIGTFAGALVLSQTPSGAILDLGTVVGWKITVAV